MMNAAQEKAYRFVAIIPLVTLLTLTCDLTSSYGIGGPDKSESTEVDFDRHVASLLNRFGCNAGACHGSFQGRGGLNLSLFGHDPAHDYQALTREAFGRRVDVVNPDHSLLLLKATGQVPHEGGQRFEPGSWEYQVIRNWIAQGARRNPARADVATIEIKPSELTLAKPGDTAKLSVIARFVDGTEVDVTRFCDLHAKDDAVAEVSPRGEIRGLRPGDSAVVASYRGVLASLRVVVPTGRLVSLPDVPETDIIDREVFAKLGALGIAPSGPSSDAEFLRRVTLDTIGTLPSPDEVRSFLDDPSPEKRAATIDRLLAHPMHAALWATRFLDITGCDVNAMEGPPELRPRRARMWHDWFRKRIAENRRYDAIARGVLCATSRDGSDIRHWLEAEAARLMAAQSGADTDYAEKPSLDLFWRRFANDEFFPIEQMAERTATAFLGVRIECAQCHKHPFDRWTQSDYRSYANIFAKVNLGLSPEGLAETAKLLEERRAADPKAGLAPIPRLREVYAATRASRRLPDPTTKQPLVPRALGGPELPGKGDPREHLFAWMTQADNPYFGPSFVNRVWAVYFGVGLVEPVDGFSVANPPSNARLLDALSADFVAHGYDIRRLERLILSSKAYQRSSEPTDDNREDRGSFAHAMPKMLMAEVLVDALNAALGVPGDFGGDAPKGARAIEIASNQVENPELARVFRIFGRPQRTSTCECERPSEPAVPQTLFLMTDSALLDKVANGRVRRLIESDACNAEALDDLFLATLSRFPLDVERNAALHHLELASNRKAALADVLWALINTREFILNH